jgi:hypothetical protein
VSGSSASSRQVEKRTVSWNTSYGMVVSVYGMTYGDKRTS